MTQIHYFECYHETISQQEIFKICYLAEIIFKCFDHIYLSVYCKTEVAIVISKMAEVIAILNIIHVCEPKMCNISDKYSKH